MNSESLLHSEVEDVETNVLLLNKILKYVVRVKWSSVKELGYDRVSTLSRSLMATKTYQEIVEG